jgi:hypothetical protein
MPPTTPPAMAPTFEPEPVLSLAGGLCTGVLGKQMEWAHLSQDWAMSRQVSPSPQGGHGGFVVGQLTTQRRDGRLRGDRLESRTVRERIAMTREKPTHC